jgi:hypothetical protein
MTTDPRPALADAIGPRLTDTLTDSQAADVHQAWLLIADVEGPHIARAWLIGMCPALGDVSPITAIRNGHTAAVLAAARGYLD